MAKIFITGGAGYIGSHCVKFLVDAGYDCIVYDNLSRGHKEFVKWCPLIVGDIRDKEQLKKTFRDHKFDAVMHFAALAYVGESVLNPILYWDNNVIGTKTLLESMLEANIKKLVFSSTCAVYGQPDELPIFETTIKSPVNPYGWTKLACESLMDQLDVSCSLKSIRFRYFNAAGSDYKSGLGECHVPETHLIPLVVGSALGKSPPLEILGADYPTPDGTAVRDYIHIKDLAVAHKAGLEHLLHGGDTAVFNLGTGVGTSVIDVVRMVEEVSKLKVDYRCSERRQGDPAQLVANVDLVYKKLGWRSNFDLREIVSDAINWQKL